jgi:hypothetical protein
MIKSKEMMLICALAISSLVVQAQATDKVPASSPANGGATGILSAVPAEAWGAILIKDMTATSSLVDTYGKTLGLGSVSIEKWLTRTLGVGGQLDMSNPIALVIMSKDRYGDEPIALVVTVKDYEKFAAELKGETTETAGVMKGKGESESVYFGKRGSYLVIAPTETLVKAIIGSKQSFISTLGVSSKKMIESSDVFARVNVTSLNQFLKPTLMGIGAMMQMGAMGGMGGMGGMGEGEDGADTKAMAQMQAMQSAGAVINAFVGFLDETEGFNIGLKLEPKNIRASFMFDFKAGQEMSKILAAQKMTDQPLIKGVAGDNFVLALGYQWDFSRIPPFQQAMLQINPGFTDPADFDKYKAVNTELAKMGTGVALKINLLKAQKGKPLFELQQVASATDAKKFVELTRQMFELQAKAKAGTGKPEFKIQKGALTVEGVSVDQVTVDLNSLFAMPGIQPDQTKEVKNIIGALLGGESKTVTLFVAPVTDKQAVMYLGGDEAGLGKLIKSVKAGETPLAKNGKVAEAAKQLPKNRVMEGYLDVGKLASGLMTIAMMSGEGKEMPATFPVIETPLVGTAVVVEGNSMKMDVVMPLDVVTKLMGLRYMVPSLGSGGANDSEEVEELEIDEDNNVEEGNAED